VLTKKEPKQSSTNKRRRKTREEMDQNGEEAEITFPCRSTNNKGLPLTLGATSIYLTDFLEQAQTNSIA
jgi:hypothetical protein